MSKIPVWLAFLALGLAVAGDAWSQGLPTATLSGRVINEGQGLPGVSVTVKSPNLQGSRSTVTAGSGDYAFIALPSGKYTVTYSLSGFQNLVKQVDLGASQTVTLNATLSLTAVSAEATVVGRSESISQTTQAATTITAEIMNTLPTSRTQLAAVELAPGLNSNGLRSTQAAPVYTISGATSFDNLFLINGANVQDNIRNTPGAYFIPDAIQETTVSTSGISAEYGRFAGGVVNTITKSGGNSFSGSGRVNFSNPAWSATVPRGSDGTQNVVETYEETLGGPIWKDRIWLFLAARQADTATTQTTAYTGIPYDVTSSAPRYEGKLTLTPVQNHTLTASYFKQEITTNNNSFAGVTYDLLPLASRKDVQNFEVFNYNGVFSSNFFAEAQFSQKRAGIYSGSTTHTLVEGTPIIDSTTGYQMGAPIFCADCPNGGDKRDNNDWFVKATYFLTTPSLGSQNIVIGFDKFTSTRFSNNWQSGNNYYLQSSGAVAVGKTIYPIFANDGYSYLDYSPINQVGGWSNLGTQSVFLNDSWKLNNHVSFNVGVRYDKNNIVDAGGVQRQNDSAFSPRLGVTVDPTGDGKLRFSASYSSYVAAVTEGPISRVGGAGNPAYYYYQYTGPDINSGGAPYLSMFDAIAKVYNWFGITAPNQYASQNIVYLSTPKVPGLNTAIVNNMKSPHTNEFALGMSGAVGSSFTYRVDGIYRQSSDVASYAINMGTGQVTDPASGSRFDIMVLQNGSSDVYKRDYAGLTTQFAWRALDGLTVGGNWTWSHTYGNQIGETTGNGADPDQYETYPEYRQLRWNAPNGDLPQDQRHRVRLLAAYDLQFPKEVGRVNISGVFAADSGHPYSAAAPVNVSKYVTNPGYASPPTSLTYYFSGRGEYTTEPVYRADLALNWSYQIGPVEVYFQPQVTNVFNAEHAVAVNSSVSVKAAFNPYTQTPVEGVNWAKGSNFGKPTSSTQYQLPRTFLCSAGLRF